MPTVDSYGNINSGVQNKTDIINFYKQARPELKIDCDPQSTSKFRILSSNYDDVDPHEVAEIFRNTMKHGDTSSIAPSSTTSVNTTILGSNGNTKPAEELNLQKPSFGEDSSYERSQDKGIIRTQVRMILYFHSNFVSEFCKVAFKPKFGHNLSNVDKLSQVQQSEKFK